MIVPSSLRRVALAAVACGLLISAARPICASDQEPSLRTELEMVYESYLRAVKNDDAPLLLSVLTEERITSLRRAFRDNGMKFPDQYFALFKRHSPTMPPLQGFRFVATTEGTKYANLIYTGDMKGYLRKAENEQRFLVIQFEKEKDGWKYSVVVDPPIDLVPNLESKLKEGDLSFLRFKPFAADRIELLP